MNIPEKQEGVFYRACVYNTENGPYIGWDTFEITATTPQGAWYRSNHTHDGGKGTWYSNRTRYLHAEPQDALRQLYRRRWSYAQHSTRNLRSAVESIKVLGEYLNEPSAFTDPCIIMWE